MHTEHVGYAVGVQGTVTIITGKPTSESGWFGGRNSCEAYRQDELG